VEFAGEEDVTVRSFYFQCGFSGMDRRDFLFGAAASAMSPLARAQDAATRGKLDRISLLTNDFSGLLPEVWEDWNKQPAPLKMNMLDLPEEVADRLHLHNLEVCNINLVSMEPSYIGEFKERMHRAKSKAVDLIVELDPPATAYRGYISVCSPNPEIRAHAIEETKKWIDIAAVLGSPSIMPDQGVHYLPGSPSRRPAPPVGSKTAHSGRREFQAAPWNREDLQALTPCIEGLKTVVDYGKTKGVVVILEPRGEPLDELVYMLMGSGAHANPQISTLAGLRLLYPLATTVQHVSLRANLATAIPLSKELGFQGWFSIETDGPDAWAEIQKVINALLLYL
jgi:sugar phosphate isomerase/epimerase